jgi:dCTP deaminase
VNRLIGEHAYHYRMTDPFNEKPVFRGVISCGLSSYGHDLRVSNEIQDFLTM